MPGRKTGSGGNSASSLIVMAAAVLLLSYIGGAPRCILGVMLLWHDGRDEVAHTIAMGGSHRCDRRWLPR